MLLRPIRKITPDLVISEWENIQRIMVSLALKTTTQSIIVSKLSAYARKNKTRRALREVRYRYTGRWEYDNIIRSLYLLDYIDFPPLRSNVQRALNRGENYHQLRRAVSYANWWLWLVRNLRLGSCASKTNMNSNSGMNAPV